MKQHKSMTYTLCGDLDGMSVKKLRELLDDYPDDAVLESVVEYEYRFGGYEPVTDRFVFKWKE